MEGDGGALSLEEETTDGEEECTDDSIDEFMYEYTEEESALKSSDDLSMIMGDESVVACNSRRGLGALSNTDVWVGPVGLR